MYLHTLHHAGTVALSVSTRDITMYQHMNVFCQLVCVFSKWHRRATSACPSLGPSLRSSYKHGYKSEGIQGPDLCQTWEYTKLTDWIKIRCFHLLYLGHGVRGTDRDWEWWPTGRPWTPLQKYCVCVCVWLADVVCVAWCVALVLYSSLCDTLSQSTTVYHFLQRYLYG